MRTTRSSQYELNDLNKVTQQLFVPFLALILITALCEFFGFLVPVRRLTEWLLQPISSASAQMIHLIELPYFVTRQSFKTYTYVQDLELRYSEAVAQLGELESIKKENQELRDLISQKQVSSVSKPVIAPILAYSQPYIGKGKRDGVKEGDLVMIGKTLIGRVEEVSDSQSIVTLLTSSTSLPLLVKTESGVTGVAVGDGRQLLMKEIPQDAAVQTDERILTVGQPEVPAGISIGRLRSLSKSAVNSSQVGSIDQVISFYESHIVEVQPR
jgi:cell shape-determining protein MreC